MKEILKFKNLLFLSIFILLSSCGQTIDVDDEEKMLREARRSQQEAEHSKPSEDVKEDGHKWHKYHAHINIQMHLEAYFLLKLRLTVG